MSLPGGTVTYNSGANSLYFPIFGTTDGDQLQPYNYIDDVYARLGQVGSSVQTIGSVSPDSQVIAHYFTNSFADGLVKQAIIHLWAGTFVVVVDPLGNVKTCVCKRPTKARVSQGKYNFNGTQYPVRVTAAMTLEVQ